MADREERLAALQARLDQVAGSGDLSPVLGPDVLTEAERLAEIADSDLQARRVLGWLHWYRHLAMPGHQESQDRSDAIRMFTPCFIAGADDLPQALLPELAERAADDATDMLRQMTSAPDEALVATTVDLWRRILSALPADNPHRPGFLTNLAAALKERFFWGGAAKADLDAAVEAARAAVDTSSAGNPARPLFLSNLNTMLLLRFEQTGSLADLDAAVEAGHAALAATPAVHSGRPLYLGSLAAALRARFQETGVPADLDAAVDFIQSAADALPPGNPQRREYLSDLGNVLALRFERRGELADLDAAVKADRAAVDATPAGSPDRPRSLSNLGAALGLRFERNGVLADLDAAIEAAQAAVDATAPVHPERPGYLSTVGVVFARRFDRIGARADLDAAVEANRAAVDACPSGHPARQRYLTNLGAALRRLFDRTGSLADLDAAIEACQAAVDATPVGHPDRPMFLSNLGSTWQARFERTGSLADLSAAIEACQAAVEATPAGHPDRPGYLHNLGLMLRTRFEWSGPLADVDAAIEACQAAVEATPAGHPDLAANLVVLGRALMRRFERTGVRADRDVALSSYAQAADIEAAEPSVRISAARSAAPLAADAEPGRAASLLAGAIRLLPEVAPRQLERSDQQYAIGGFAGLAGDAAALALADPGSPRGERAAKALGLLEAGRAVLLSQALDTRSDLADLRHRHPDLAARFAELRDHLDQPSSESVPATALAGPGAADRDCALVDRHWLANEFTALLEQIRRQDGFASFGLPPAASELLVEAAPGPVVTFNVSVYGSAALLLTTDGVTSLPLPDVAYDTLIGQINSFRQALHTGTDPGASSPERVAAQKKLLEILGWLWDSAAEPVLDTLGYGRTPPPGAAWPRVWWAPGGLLGLLPVHAAGHHAKPAAPGLVRRTVMDRVISSYTPTIRALRYARQHARRAASVSGRTLIVAMPVTPGLPGGGVLPHVPAEADRVRALVPDPLILAEPGIPVSGSSGIPTRASVLRRLPECSIAHFACHGVSDPIDPSSSLLLLHDHGSAPLTVANLAPVNLDQAQLAYLSACTTAFTRAVRLTDEAVHLTTAFQLAGFPHVIGTLWEINDDVAVEMAGMFYSALRTGPHVRDSSRAASALHHAVRTLRDNYPNSPALWAAYLHAGS